MKKVLLVDTNFSSIPIYNWLVSSGFFVYLVGGNAHDYMARKFPNYINVDYSNEKLLNDIVEEYGIDFVVPGCNDSSYEACSMFYGSNKLCNIDNPENTRKLIDKNKFRELCVQLNIPAPRAYRYEEASRVLKCKDLIVKPKDAYSGLGITRLKKNSNSCIDKAIEYAKDNSKKSGYVIEDFVDGELYSHSAFIEDGNIVKDFFVKEYCGRNKYAVDTSFVCFDFPLVVANNIRLSIELISKKLKLSNGLIHTQFILSDKSFWLIEITRRCPGDLYSKLIELSTGFDYAGVYVSYFIGCNKISHNKNNSVRHIVRHTLSQGKEGIFFGISYKIKLPIVKQFNLSLVGDFVNSSTKGRLGISFCEFDTEEKAKEVSELYVKNDVYCIEIAGL